MTTTTPTPIAVFNTAARDIRRAIIRAHANGIDIGELLFDAVTTADRQIKKSEPWSGVTSSRPGGWEAGIVEQLVAPDWL